MKKMVTYIFLVVAATLASAQDDIQSYFGFSTFNTPSESPYVEAYFSVDARGLTFQEADDQFRAGAEITILFYKGEKVVNFDKFNLLTEPVENPDEANFSIMTQRRIALENGTYEVEVEIKDINNPDKVTRYPRESMTIEFEPGEVGISDIRLIKYIRGEKEGSVFNKNGFNLYPYLVNYYPTALSKMHFYAEVYNLDETYLDEDVLVTYSIHQQGNEMPVSGLMRYSKQKGQEVNVVVGTLDLTDLPSGKYDFELQVRSRQNKLLAEQTMPLYRSNKRAISNLDNMGMVNVKNTFAEELDPDKMEWYLKGLKPIASDREEQAINTVLEAEDTTLQRQFFYNFWTDRNLQQPEKEWEKYHSQLLFVRDEFRIMNRYGFETDRGRVYLQYGQPDERFESDYESNSPPYEIWRYNRTYNGETNVRFVFQSTDIISNDYELKHSDATGEIKNENWQSELDGRFPNPGGLDPHDPRGSFGNSNSEIFDRR